MEEDIHESAVTRSKLDMTFAHQLGRCPQKKLRHFTYWWENIPLLFMLMTFMVKRTYPNIVICTGRLLLFMLVAAVAVKDIQALYVNMTAVRKIIQLSNFMNFFKHDFFFFQHHEIDRKYTFHVGSFMTKMYKTKCLKLFKNL